MDESAIVVLAYGALFISALFLMVDVYIRSRDHAGSGKMMVSRIETVGTLPESPEYSGIASPNLSKEWGSVDTEVMKGTSKHHQVLMSRGDGNRVSGGALR